MSTTRRNPSAPAREMRLRGKLAAPMTLSDTPRFYCEICKKTFNSASALMAHGQKEHGR